MFSWCIRGFKEVLKVIIELIYMKNEGRMNYLWSKDILFKFDCILWFKEE